MTDVYTPILHRADPTPAARSVVSAVIPATQGDYLVPIPFKGRLVHCQTSVIILVGGTHDVALSLEKNAAGGTTMGTATIAKDSTVGTEDTVTLTTTDPETNLVVDNQDICLAVTGSQTDGLMSCQLIFEPTVGV